MKKNILLDTTNNYLSAIIKKVNNDFNSLNEEYFSKYNNIFSWIIASDYSFDKNKNNYCITFNLFPFPYDFNKFNNIIKKLAPKEIKNTRNVNKIFLQFIKNNPILNISFIFNKNDYFIWNSKDYFLKCVKATEIYLNTIKSFQNQNFIKKVNDFLKLCYEDKKIKLFVKMFLITLLGSIIVSEGSKLLNIKKISWFSDRDAIHDLCDTISLDSFYNWLNFLTDKEIKFGMGKATSDAEEWYEDIIKIPEISRSRASEKL